MRSLAIFQTFLETRDIAMSPSARKIFASFFLKPRTKANVVGYRTVGYWMASIPIYIAGPARLYQDETQHGGGGTIPSSSRDIFYGGNKQSTTIHSKIDGIRRPEILRETSVWIDVHTDLGSHGMDTLIMVARAGTDQKLLKRYFPSVFSIVTPDATNQAAMVEGYDLTRGLLVEYLQDHHASTTSTTTR
jgi:hypothetical protein